MENNFLDAESLKNDWDTNPRWRGITRNYSAEDVISIRNSVEIKHTLAENGAQKLFEDLNKKDEWISALGALSGNQAVQMVKAGLKAIYLSGWQVAADSNLGETTYPDQSLYPSNSAPTLAKRINNALLRAEQVDRVEGNNSIDYLVPIVADGEAGFGGTLNVFELTKKFIEAGAAGVHFEDQLAAEKKCGHMGGKVLVPTSQHIRTLTSARLASDTMGVPTVIIARTDALAANLVTSDIDEIDSDFVLGERTSEGFFKVKNGPESAISRGLSYAPYSDLVWCETGKPDIGFAKEFADAIHEKFPDKLLAYNCSPSFNWKQSLSDDEIATFQEKLSSFGYKFQFITLAGFHALNTSMFELAMKYKGGNMSAYVELQQKEFALEKDGFTSVKHQREVGAGYFDTISTIISDGDASTLALKGSTEEEQF
ncbi:isocitrate lyase [Acidimicrobiaceae bacterium]|nr:isocitrate lyase [Acidimicrobiaceae bacterium]|tara:strand:- start:2267 stop:3547 length:1281 start_codon:yes stop_codon:yes gene_type:complete